MGRASKRDEAVISAVVNKSWVIIDEYLDDEKVELIKKQKIALEIVKRTCPSEAKVDLDLNVKLINHIPRPDQPKPKENTEK